MRLLLVIATSVLLAVSGHALPQTKSVRNSRIIDSLPAPQDAEIRKIQTADKWRNPYVIVYPDGYELILPNKKRTDAHLALGELENALLDLPWEGWPLGKVIAVQETGIRSLGDDPRIEEIGRAS